MSKEVIKQELLPCPFCGATSAGVTRMTVTHDGYKVRCNTCFAHTQDERSEAKAVESWNTRYDSTQQELSKLKEVCGEVLIWFDDTWGHGRAGFVEDGCAIANRLRSLLKD